MKNPQKDVCSYYLERKGRFCKMKSKIGFEMCCEHDKSNIERIPCPLDPKHSVERSFLEKHLKICNVSKISLQISKGFKEDINIPLQEFYNCEGRNDLISFIMSSQNERNISLKSWHHGEPNKLLKGKSTRHLYQNELLSSVLLKDIKGDFVFIEMGAGKGGLSKGIANYLYGFEDIGFEKKYKSTTKDDANATKFFLIDKRKNFRSKGDSFLKKAGCEFERIFIDIKDVDLDLIIPIECKNIIIAGKHLCGGATCLTINALEKLIEKRKGLKIVFGVATCCHQLCSWDSFTDLDKLIKDGINKENFDKIRKASSWAVCKNRLPYNLFHNNINIFREDMDVDPKEYGIACKSYIDDIRCQKLKEMGMVVEMEEYCHSDISLENKIIIAKME